MSTKINIILLTSFLCLLSSFYFADRLTFTSSGSYFIGKFYRVDPNHQQAVVQTLPTMGPSHKQPNTIQSVIYYVNWAIYARNHFPQHLAAQQYTHILYAFANIRPESGEVYLTDPWADTDKHFEGDSWNDVGTNLYGCLKQLYILKKQNRQLKILLSIGGWTYSSNFAQPSSTEAGRITFAKSAVRLLEDLGLDGLDVDWEYPQDQAQSQNYVLLLQACRRELDAAAAKRSKPTHFCLSAAVPAGGSNYEKLQIPQMDQHLDFWNLMAYDYAGSWDQMTGHQANLYPDRSSPPCTPFNTVDAIRHYTSHGVAPAKLILGMPLYGRDFGSTDGLGSSYSGHGQGSWERGVWDYKALPQPGAQESYNESIGASWSYDKANRLLVTYDTPVVAQQKARYVAESQLGGGMWWESSGDKASGSGSLVEAFLTECYRCGRRLDQDENCLEYPESKYGNVRTGMQT